MCSMLFAANSAVEQQDIATALVIMLIRRLYLHASDVHQHSTFN